MKYTIEFADNNGIEMLGSDSIMPFDNRLSHRNALGLAYDRIRKQAEYYLSNPEKAVKPRQCYARVTMGIKGQAVTEWASLENPIFQ